MTVMNEYEASSFEQTTGDSLESKIGAFGKIGIVTLGETGSKIFANGRITHIPATFSETVVDATGC